jgi:hypothetical protein
MVTDGEEEGTQDIDKRYRHCDNFGGLVNMERANFLDLPARVQQGKQSV